MPERIAVAHRPQEGAADIFKNAHFGENIGDLKAAAQTEAINLMRQLIGNNIIVELNIARRDLIETADEVKKG